VPLPQTQNINVGADPKTLILHHVLNSISPGVAAGGASATLANLNPQTTLNQLLGIADHPTANAPEKIWAAGDALTQANKKGALPLALILRLLFLNDPAKMRQLSQLMSQGSALAALPNIAIRTTDAVSRIAESDDKLKALGQIAPGSILRSLSDLSPSIIYQINQLL